MEDLDAELLAVTERQKQSGRPDLSEGSASSGGEFEGMEDSDAPDDDDDPMLDQEDEDDDDDFGLDDDDEQYPKSKSRTSKKPSKTTRPKKAKARPKPKRKPVSKPASDDDDDDIFEYKYDPDGYGDHADRDRLASMNEVDRETLLTERVEARQKQYEVWNMRREMRARQISKNRAAASSRGARSSARSKPTSKSDALQALAEDKRKKSSRALDDVSDADSEVERVPKRDAKDGKRTRSTEKDEPRGMDDDEGPELRYRDLVNDEKKTSCLFLRRHMLVELSQKPYFERTVVGLFARIRSFSDYDESSYLLCRIVAVEKGKVYSLSDSMKTNIHLQLQIGEGRRQFTILMTSGSHPTEKEFDVYRTRTLDARLDMPRRDEVEKLMRKAHDMVYGGKAVATEEENKQHIANMELLYPSRVNWTRKRTEAQTALQIKRQELAVVKRKGAGDAMEKVQSEADELLKELRDIEANEKQFGVKSGKSDTSVFHSLARRNMALNNSNDLLMAKRRTLEADGSGIDPFARFDTTGQSYFSIRKKGGVEGDKVKVTAKRKSIDAKQRDWKATLKTFQTGGKRRKISEKPIDPTYDVELVGLDDFLKEIPSEDLDSKGEKHGPPTGVDAIYSKGARISNCRLPKNSKVISFAEWSKMRS